MLDIHLRSLKDGLFDPLCRYIPAFVTPLHITGFAFLCGLSGCVSTLYGKRDLSLALWALNRALDCLDGALARHRQQASDLGGFLDLLCDFIVYSLIPICCAGGAPSSSARISLWQSVATVEASFHINNFVLFYVAAVAAKVPSNAAAPRARELTSVSMRPALVEGFESGLLFTWMLAVPQHTEMLCWVMAGLVAVGIAQRVLWVIPVL